MKNIIYKIIIPALLGVSLMGCEDFDAINDDPMAASADQVQVEYFINQSIIGAQQNPHVAERIFVLYWKGTGMHHLGGGIALGTHNDGWSVDYWGSASSWLNAASTAIQIGNEKAENGSAQPYNENLIQVARIWRAYLMSELTDSFGPLPVNAFQGVNPEFVSTKEVYDYMLEELAQSQAAIDVNIARPSKLQNLDAAYMYEWEKWIRFANSLRMRLSMRLSEVDPAKASTEFQAAASTNMYIADASHNFTVEERPGWDDLTGVMSREWNIQWLSSTLNNLYVGLGGVPTQSQVASQMHGHIKPADYLGMYFPDQYADRTNDPAKAHWLDGLPEAMDPRAYKAFYIPGDFNNQNYSFFPSWTNDARNQQGYLLETNGDTVKIDATYTWNAFANGDWGAKGTRNRLRGIVGKAPALGQQFRSSNNRRVFFGSWESYFLLAEAAVRGWTVSMSDEQAYETGVRHSFEYFNVGQFADAYLSSDAYNRNGTSARFSHTQEPPSTVAMTHRIGKNGPVTTFNYAYPTNNLYQSGAIRNDKLTKIITQKYLANVPWLPLEGWNDHRRLGLPFFVNPAVENPLPNLPGLNSSSYMTSSNAFFPQRLPYPSSLRNADPTGYAAATGFLDGPDAVLTPLYWAKK
ncbi:SusD/RagB family nutrient-binding outer membrane lipoprotein [Belliella marina]|uniref:SusD/RagB family nutrient-binding outer membrane lipoprotein n=1 Tax=Belliella marina TaxID=1644146 RepID=A0ABW4VGS4_9BACT